ncbi:MAG: methionine synthase [Acidimicrobiia bacterium]|nr:methionine synthase [Acidimicrobiia bacterium]
MNKYVEATRSRVVIYDGAMGTSLQQAELTADDFGGDDLEGCNEVLNVTRPDVIRRIHAEYLDVGVDVIETNSFGGFSIPLAEYGIADRVHELNIAAARIAREVADGYSTPARPRWVAGSIGPGTKFPTLRQIRYVELRDAYEEQALGLIEGGVDLFIIETQFDLLGLKAAMNGTRRAMRSAGRSVPIQAQVTIEATGRMLPGTEIGAALAAIDPLHPDVFGLNCATGPTEMTEHIRYLSERARMPIAVIPNAGLPEVLDGAMCYNLSPTQLAEHHTRFISEFGVSVVGGCCGTTPEHLRAVVSAVADLEPVTRQIRHEPGAASTYSFTPFQQETSFLIIGERTNANGSKRFRETMLANDWDGCVQMGKDQVKEGAHLVDLCVDYVGRDGAADMDELASRFATQVGVPLVLDSTEPEVMEAGLQWIGGRAVLNSVNLEDGEGPGSRFDQVMSLARDYGAAVVCLLIDEDGQARDVEWKMRIAHRIHRLAGERYGLEPGDLIFDPLTFPLTTGDDALRRDAMATLEAIKRIKIELPGTFTSLGVSNVSFGLKMAIRHVLNSVFLHEALQVGLDGAIIHAGRIIPLHRIPDDQREASLDLIYDRRSDGYDPLERVMALFADATTMAVEQEDRSDWPVEQRLEYRIIEGDRDGLTDDLDEALQSRPAVEIINGTLLSGMKTVGDLFASGDMQLPFVLQSAETMKAAVGHLEPHMDKADSSGRGSIVLATVKGDVHDIGKNLVDIILTNNGYDVHNLGIKVTITEMIDKAIEVDADAIGMSGLLVKSTLIMRENLIELQTRQLAHLPVILGGAALTRSYVERDLRDAYPGPLFYGKDAFAGLAVMERIAANADLPDPDFGRIAESRVLPPRRAKVAPDARDAVRSPEVETTNPVFIPPFLGSRVVKGIPLDDIGAYLNETALFRNQWHFRPEDAEDDAAFKERIRPVLRAQLDKAKRKNLLIPQVVYGYFPVNSDGNDLVVWENDNRDRELTRFSFPRQADSPFLCIADFHRPVADGADYAAFHIVTMGDRASARAAELFAAHRYEDYLYLHGLAVELAEALAEYWHHRIRSEWGFVDEDGPSLSGLFRQKYRGGRYSWGYPACPDLADNEKVANLLGADRVGVSVGEDTGWQYQPEQTTSAIICHHPQAKYFIAR